VFPVLPAPPRPVSPAPETPVLPEPKLDPPLLLPMKVAEIEPEPEVLDEKLEPLDLLPLPLLLLELLDMLDSVTSDSPDDESTSVKPGPDPEDASLWVQTPSARYVLVPGTRSATVRTRPSIRSIEMLRPGDEVQSLVVPGLKTDVPFKAQYQWLSTWGLEGASMRPARVSHISIGEHDGFFVINRRIKATFEHPFLVRRGDAWGFCSADLLQVGDCLITPLATGHGEDRIDSIGTRRP
jgi:hypothetical protein